MYRQIVRDIAVNYHPLSDTDKQDNEFFEYLRKGYLEAKQHQERSEIFIFAAGLLTYGQIEMVDDILDNIPSGKAHVRRLAWTVTTLLPIPQNIDVFKDAEAIKKWLNEHKDRLSWNAEQKHFYVDPIVDEQ